MHVYMHAGCTVTTWKSGTGPVDQGVVRELLSSDDKFRLFGHNNRLLHSGVRLLGCVSDYSAA